MPLTSRAWIGLHRLRRRASRVRGDAYDRTSIIREYAPGRSWLDVGCMWNVHGGLCFLAEEAGAVSVCGVDVIGETPEFQAERARRGSSVRFVQGDLHSPMVLQAAGEADVVWCSGVLYHAPHPVLTLERLRSVTGQTLLLSTESLPELPGVPGGCVFYPGLDDRARAVYSRVPGGRALAVTEPYASAEGYGNWFWGITPSALDGFLRVAGFEVERRWQPNPFFTVVAARPV